MKKKTTTPHDDMIQEQRDDITNALADAFSERFSEYMDKYNETGEYPYGIMPKMSKKETLAKGGIVQDNAGISIAPEGSEFIVPLSAIENFGRTDSVVTFQQNDEMVDRVITNLQSKFSEAMAKSVSEKIISLRQPDTPMLEAGDGYEIILPESYKNTPMMITNPYADIQEVHFGKMPLSEVFAKQLAKKRIRAIEKAKAKTKRRKANKAAKKSRKK